MGSTALILAAMNGRNEICEMILSKEKYLLDQDYLNSKLQCDEGYLTRALSYFCFLFHLLAHSFRIHYRNHIHQFCSVEANRRGRIQDLLPLIDSTTTHYAAEKQRLLAENEYIKHSQDRMMRAFQDSLDSFGNRLVAHLNDHSGSSSYAQWKLIEDKLDEQARRIQDFVGMQIAQSQMLGTVIGGTYSIPTLCIVLPKINKTILSRMNPFNVHVITNEYRMFFICSHTLRIVPCGPKGKGYKFSETKDWVKRAAPVLKVGLMLLKLGLAASGLPLPIPGLEDVLDVAYSSSLLDTAINIVDGINMDKDVSSLTVDQHLHSLTRDDAHQIRSAYEEIKSLLTDSSRGLDKHLQYLNMIQRSCTETGITAWIKNDPNVIKSFDDHKGHRIMTKPTVTP